jgi:hypothetical protein
VRWIDEVLDLALEHPIAPSSAKKEAKPAVRKTSKPSTSARREVRRH